MSQHCATVEWKRQGDFVYATYSRMHEVRFESGVTFTGRASPSNIPKTAPSGPGIDPEEGFVHRYIDEAVGVLDRTWMSKVTLRPRVTFSGKAPSEEQHRALHHKAHEKCYIANSIKSAVFVEPAIDQG